VTTTKPVIDSASEPPIPPVNCPTMVLKGSKRRLSRTDLKALQEQGRTLGEMHGSKGGSVTGASKVRSPEALAAAVAARIEANKARKHAVEVELPALRAEVEALRAEVAELRRKLRTRES